MVEHDGNAVIEELWHQCSEIGRVALDLDLPAHRFGRCKQSPPLGCSEVRQGLADEIEAP